MKIGDMVFLKEGLVSRKLIGVPLLVVKKYDTIGNIQLLDPRDGSKFLCDVDDVWEPVGENLGC